MKKRELKIKIAAIFISSLITSLFSTVHAKDVMGIYAKKNDKNIITVVLFNEPIPRVGKISDTLLNIQEDESISTFETQTKAKKFTFITPINWHLDTRSTDFGGHVKANPAFSTKVVDTFDTPFSESKNSKAVINNVAMVDMASEELSSGAVSTSNEPNTYLKEETLRERLKMVRDKQIPFGLSDEMKQGMNIPLKLGISHPRKTTFEGLFFEETTDVQTVKDLYLKSLKTKNHYGHRFIITPLLATNILDIASACDALNTSINQWLDSSTRAIGRTTIIIDCSDQLPGIDYIHHFLQGEGYTIEKSLADAYKESEATGGASAKANYKPVLEE